MNVIYSLTTIVTFIFLIIYFMDFKNIKFIKNNYFIIIFIGFSVRILLSITFNFEFGSDLNTFKSWSLMLFSNGFYDFYNSASFTDYPPGYMYILFIIGGLYNFLGLSFESEAFTLIIKLPAMVFDILTGIFIYKISLKKFEPNWALLFSLLYILNPMIILDSTIWGQVDAVYTFVLILTIYYITENKNICAYLLFTLSILIKPQSLIISPIILFSIYDYLKINNFDKKSILYMIKAFTYCILLFITIILPFALKITLDGITINFQSIFTQYRSTISSYPYVTLNAYNVYALFGLNWHSVNETFLNLTYSAWGFIFITLFSFYSIFILYKYKDKSTYFFVAGMLNTLTYMLSIKMHERYLFPSLAFFFIAYLYTKNKKLLLLYFGFSVTLFINCFDVLYANHNFNSLLLEGNSLIIISLINVILSLYMVLISFKSSTHTEYDSQISLLKKERIVKKYDPMPSFKFAKMVKKDYVLLLSLTLIYSILAFVNLGNLHSPQSYWIGTQNESVVIELENTSYITDIMFMVGAENNQSFILEYSTDGINYTYFDEIEATNVFAWQKIPINATAKYIKITPTTESLWLQEIGFYSNENLLTVTYDNTTQNLFDEQELVPYEPSYMNSTYFDEIYHARSGYEYANSIEIYETTHPPLGKFIISIGIRIFGMTPFGWRFMGTLFGVMMLPAIYVFAKKMFSSTEFAFVATVLYAFDFMHFTQTRIATIDTYNTFFVILTYYFMYLYYKTSFYDTKLLTTLKYLFFSGIFLGLAMASKWQGCYAAIGIAIIFFINVYWRYREYVYAKSIGNEEIYNKFVPNILITFGSCIIFFVVVPITIYCLSYIPYLIANDLHGFKAIIDSQIYMYTYHSDLVATHPYSSTWLQWIFDIRPIFYYANTLPNDMKSGISSFGNPFVWWGGIIAFFYSCYILSRRSSKTILFLYIAFMAQLWPWILINRVAFIYHYMPCVPFLVLLITYCLKDYYDLTNNSLLIKLYVTSVVFLFFMFYPVLSGFPVSEDYVNNFLRWLPSWQLIY